MGRFCIESLRTDSLMAGSMRTSQLVAVLAVVGGAILFLILRRRALSLPRTLEITPDTDVQLKASDDDTLTAAETAEEIE